MIKNMDYYLDPEHATEWEDLSDTEKADVYQGASMLDDAAVTHQPAGELAPVVEQQPEPEKAPVILTADGKHTLPFTELQAARDRAALLERTLGEQQALIQSLRDAATKDTAAGGGTAAQEKVLEEYKGDFPEMMEDIEPRIKELIEHGASDLVKALQQEVTNLRAEIAPLKQTIEQDQAVAAQTDRDNWNGSIAKFFGDETNQMFNKEQNPTLHRLLDDEVKRIANDGTFQDYDTLLATAKGNVVTLLEQATGKAPVTTTTAPTVAEVAAQKIAAATAENLAKKIETQKAKISEVKNALEQATAAYGTADSRTKDYAIQLNKSEAALKGMEAELKDNEAAAKQTGTSMDKAGTQTKGLGNDMDNASSKALSFGDVLKANVVGGVILDGLRAIADGLKQLASDALSLADTMMIQSDQTGVSTQRLQELQYIGDDVGVSFETIAGAQSKLTKSMADASSGAGKNADAFKALGIEVTNSDGSLKDAQTVMNESFVALGKMSNETERDAAAMTIFGKSAMDLNPLIKAGSEKLDELSEAARTSGAVMSDETVVSLDIMSDTMAHLKQTATSAAGTFLSQFAPALQGISDGLTGLMNGSVSPEQFSKSISGIIEQVTTTITTLLPTILQAGIQILLAIIQGLVSALPQIIPAVITMVTQLAATLLGMLPEMLQMGVDVLLGIADGIISALPELIPAIVECVLKMADVLAVNLPLIINAGIEILLALVQGIIESLPMLIKMLPTIIDDMIMYFAEALPMIIETGVQMLVSLIEGLADAIPKLVDMIPTIVTTLIDVLIDNLPLIIESGITILMALLTGLIKTLPKLVMMGPEIGRTIGESLKKVDWKTLGKNIIDGIKNGITDAAAALGDAAKKAAEGALKAVKSFLGIKSPSTVMRDQVGVQMMAGAESGIDKKSASFAKATKDAMSEAVNGASSALDVLMPSNVSAKYAFAMGGQPAVSNSDTTNYIINYSGAVPVSAKDKRDMMKMFADALVSVKTSRGVAIA